MADRQAFSNISATTAAFRLAGGKYGVDCAATFGGGSVKLQKLAGDASTYVSVSTPTDFAAAGYATIDLPSGSYRFTIATATAIYVELDRISSARGA